MTHRFHRTIDVTPLAKGFARGVGASDDSVCQSSVMTWMIGAGVGFLTGAMTTIMLGWSLA